jgi:arsenate reductase
MTDFRAPGYTHWKAAVKAIVTIGIIALCWAGCTSTRTTPSHAKVIVPLRPYVNQIVNTLDRISKDRRVLLDEVVTQIVTRLASGEDVKLTFICTQNSRRSQMSQIWVQAAAYYYRLDRVHAFSGGTEATACNCRTVSAMSRVGFSIIASATGSNPVYLVRYADARPPIRAYSKLYSADGNPKTNFIALMTCSQADRKCPVVEGATARYALHYADPKLCDDTPEETTAYNERCREIAREMFYIMSQVRKRLDETIKLPRFDSYRTESGGSSR